MSTQSQAQEIRQSFENKEHYEEFEQIQLHNQTSNEAQYLFFLLRKKFPSFEKRQEIWTALSIHHSDFLSRLYRGNSIITTPELLEQLGKEDPMYPTKKAA